MIAYAGKANGRLRRKVNVAINEEQLDSSLMAALIKTL